MEACHKIKKAANRPRPHQVLDNEALPSLPLPPHFPLRRAGALSAPNTSHHSVSLLLTPFLFPLLHLLSARTSHHVSVKSVQGSFVSHVSWQSRSLPPPVVSVCTRTHLKFAVFFPVTSHSPGCLLYQVNLTNRRAESTINSYSICQVPSVLFHTGRGFLL